MISQEWHLKKNCSLTPRQLVTAYAAQCMLSFTVATLCAMKGAWYILIFAVLEMLALAIALVIYSQHAMDHEHIFFKEGYLLVEKVYGAKSERIELDPYWTRIIFPQRYQDLVCLVYRDQRIEIGQYVPGHRRKHLAKELQRQLQFCRN